MTDRGEMRQARRALGAKLARLRKAAQLTQHDLARKIDGYGRSTVANAETGHQTAHRDFWLRCDHALAANGVLIAAYDSLRELTQATYPDATDIIPETAFRPDRTEANDHGAELSAVRNEARRGGPLLDLPSVWPGEPGHAGTDVVTTHAIPMSEAGSAIGQLIGLPFTLPPDHGPSDHSFLTVTRILATQRQAVPPATLLTMIEAHRDTLATLFKRAGDAPVAADIGLMIGETSIVASRLWSAVGHRGLAVAHCAYARQLGDRLAHSSARPVRDAATILSATARIFEGNLRSDAGGLIGTGGDIALGLRMLDEAAAAEHLLPPSARARIAAEQAQTYAVLQLPAECSAALTRAQRAVDDIDAPETGLFSDWNEARLLVYEGTCLLFLGNPGRSVNVLNQAIQQMQADTSNANVVLAARVDLASAYAASGELEHGCHLLADTYTALSALGNRRGIERALAARRRLDPWRTEKAVKDLDDCIAAA